MGVNNPKRNLRENVLVFGANGFLGSVVTKKLYESGFDVLPVIRPKADKSRLQELNDIKLLEIEPSRWPELVSEYTPNAIICSQWNGVIKQDRDNVDLQRENIKPILNIGVAAKESGVGSFICFGSQAEAKESSETIKEEFYNSGESAYGNVKASLHNQLASLFEDSNCRLIWARVFSVYGPSDFSESLLMQLFQSQVSGTELKISNPFKLWSYLYEDDFASAIEQILKNPTVSSTINVGGPTLNEIREIVALWFENSIADFADDHRTTTNVGYFPEVAKLKTIGWSPSISLEEGIKRTRKAFSDRLKSK
jgi:UDP-glucose 4-epimerase